MQKEIMVKRLKNELISIIIPIYKVEPYLERCIHSVMMQTYHNLEIILVDDGSPDRCGEICECFAQKDSRIRVYHKMNGGLSDARNYGVEQSHGTYIAFIDADDYIAPDYIEYLFGLLIQYDADISCCCMIKTIENAVTYGTNSTIPREQLLTGKEACRELFGSLYDVLITAWGKLYKSEIVKKSPFPVGRKHEDEATICKYYYASKKVVVGNKCLYAYFQNLNGIMHTIGDSINMDLIWAQKHRAEYFEEQNEKILAQAAWDKLFYYCLYDSINHQGRCNHFLRNIAKRKKLSKRTQFELNLFNMSPWVFDKYLKIIIYPLGKIKEKIKYINKGKIHEPKGISK
ncbi:glycosyltransferase family 2 protein [Coprococcus catus]